MEPSGDSGYLMGVLAGLFIAWKLFEPFFENFKERFRSKPANGNGEKVYWKTMAENNSKQTQILGQIHQELQRGAMDHEFIQKQLGLLMDRRD